jgi:hypothetical protein
MGFYQVSVQTARFLLFIYMKSSPVGFTAEYTGLSNMSTHICFTQVSHFVDSCFLRCHTMYFLWVTLRRFSIKTMQRTMVGTGKNLEENGVA